jgi:thiol-disulfide isomerase/thioredoxin
MIPADRKEIFLKTLNEFKKKADEFGLKFSPADLEMELVGFSDGLRLDVKSKKNFEKGDEELIEKYKQLCSTDDFVRINVLPNLQEGSSYLPITARRIDDGTETVVSHKNGQEVILVDFWATWCGPCVSAMRHNGKMIEENFNQWNGKVRFACVSLVEERDEVKNFLKANGLDKHETVFEQYATMESEGKDFTDFYGVRGIPHVALVDKWGKIRYMGHPSTSPSLDERINSLLAETQAPQTSVNNSEENLEDFSEKAKIMENLNNLCKTYTEELSKRNVNYVSKFLANSNTLVKLNEDWSDITMKKITEAVLIVKCRANDYDEFLAKIKSAYPDYESWTWMRRAFERIETFDINPLNTCNKCQGNISEEVSQYYCHWCKVSFCETCVESTLTNQGRAKLIHPDHYLLYFKTRNKDHLSHLDLYKLGSNKFANFPEAELSTENGFGCNGCSKGSGDKARFICVSCRPGCRVSGGFIDYCPDCINVMNNPNHENYESVTTSTPGHIHSNHVYLRMDYAGDNYYEY